jgi:hypothetical protein
MGPPTTLMNSLGILKNTTQNQFFATSSFFILIMEGEKLDIQDNQWQLKKTSHLLLNSYFFIGLYISAYRKREI